MFGLTRALPGRYCLPQLLRAGKLQTLMGWYLGLDLSLTFSQDDQGRVRACCGCFSCAVPLAQCCCLLCLFGIHEARAGVGVQPQWHGPGGRNPRRVWQLGGALYLGRGVAAAAILGGARLR